ncbi:hypothetical protein SJY89_20280 [Bacillus velezensis]|uniref:hypothetical protein n=1 Tax=Bacillus TaxID=1386 RepID=UPI0028FA5D25|nr:MULTISPECIES: hypothetical protein [Bacillus]MDU0078283.1 hypothetical protein [Bacillus sp. IG2]MDU0103965.1 hypothetical protein [Bacillus sp. IS1]MDX7897511.1 hypothetical protein [Bacillus velezensis]MDX8028484.1 hypothetical protein [Bacillus velezensis]MDX8201731.1 hypothetical protein [Bacillus velezensis]
MSNKQKNLKDRIKSPTAAFFDQYKDSEDDNNINHNNDHDHNNNDDIDDIINNNNNNDHVQLGIYFEPAVVKALKPLGKKKLKSKFVNAAVKQVLKDKGML